jgi:AraC family transcriptional regulator
MGRDGAYVRVGTRTSSFARSKASWSTVLRGSRATIDHHGHWGTIHPTLDGLRATINQSRQIVWAGGSAAAVEIQSMIGEADVMASAVELYFAWNSSHIDAEVQLGGKILHCGVRPTSALIVPPGTRIAIRTRRARDFRTLSVELKPDFLLSAVGFDGPSSFDIRETVDYRDPLTWQLAHVLYEECTSGAPQGTLYTETAATLLSMHLVRNLSTVTLLKEIRRGGLPPSRLRRACDYMVSRLGEDVSLQEVAASVELSTGHFSTAFKQSSGVTPHAWMRRQRIDRAKTLLHDANLNLTQIAIILGYANQSSLGVAFKRETGVTPTQWRVREIG